MELNPKPPKRRASPVPEVGPRCASCGGATLIGPCTIKSCTRPVIVCWGCADVADRYVETDGRCPYCRVQ